MSELERTVLPEMRTYMLPWKRYVDDTITAIREDSVDLALSKLNNFNKNIQFTYELEKQQQISFLDVLIIRKDNSLETTVYRKPTNNDIYIHWDSFAPKGWCFSTLKSLLLRAYKVCSSTDYRTKEIDHIRYALTKINGYPEWTIDKTIKQIEDGPNITMPADDSNVRPTLLILPYKGAVGESLARSLRKSLQSITPGGIASKVVFKGTRLSSKFSTKDRTEKQHCHNLVYQVTCPTVTCRASYIGETGRRLGTRAAEHAGKDTKSNVVQHTLESGHRPVSLTDFRVLARNDSSRVFSRKVLESLYINRFKPSLNVQQASIPLKLFS